MCRTSTSASLFNTTGLPLLSALTARTRARARPRPHTPARLPACPPACNSLYPVACNLPPPPPRPPNTRCVDRCTLTHWYSFSTSTKAALLSTIRLQLLSAFTANRVGQLLLLKERPSDHSDRRAGGSCRMGGTGNRACRGGRKAEPGVRGSVAYLHALPCPATTHPRLPLWRPGVSKYLSAGRVKPQPPKPPSPRTHWFTEAVPSYQCINQQVAHVHISIVTVQYIH